MWPRVSAHANALRHSPGQRRQRCLSRVHVHAAVDTQAGPFEDAYDRIAKSRFDEAPGHDEAALVDPHPTRHDAHAVHLVFMMQLVAGHRGVALDGPAETELDRMSAAGILQGEGAVVVGKVEARRLDLLGIVRKAVALARYMA